MVYCVPKSKVMKRTTIDVLLKRSGGVVRTDDIVKAGYSKTTVVNIVKAGVLERVAHGIYVRPGEMYDEMYVIQLRSRRIVFSHETALWLNGLSDREPFEYHVTIPTGAPLGGLLRTACRCHYVSGELHGVGMVKRKTAFGNEVQCYDAERTICDIVRHEKRVGVEALVGGIKAYVQSDAKDLIRLMETARLFGVDKEISRYMGVLT